MSVCYVVLKNAEDEEIIRERALPNVIGRASIVSFEGRLYTYSGLQFSPDVVISFTEIQPVSLAEAIGQTFTPSKREEYDGFDEGYDESEEDARLVDLIEGLTPEDVEDDAHDR